MEKYICKVIERIVSDFVLMDNYMKGFPWTTFAFIFYLKNLTFSAYSSEE